MDDELGDDSLRVIVQRDLDYSDRMNVIALDEETLSGFVPSTGREDQLRTRWQVRGRTCWCE